MSRNPSPVPASFRRRGIRFEQVTSVMDSIGTAWVFVLLIMINVDIGGRVIFNHPIRGVPEIVSLSIVALVFLQIAHTTHVGRLTRSEMLLHYLDRRHPRFGHLLQGVHHLAGAGLFLILFSASWPMFTKAWRIAEYVGAEGDFKAPVWPVKLIILIGCAAAFIEFLLLAWRDIRNLGRRGGSS